MNVKLAVLLMLVGLMAVGFTCTGGGSLPMSVATTMVVLGAKQSGPIEVGPTFDWERRRLSDSHDVLWKETTWPEGRHVNFCIVPKWAGSGFSWRVVVSVNDKEAWTYDSLETPERRVLRGMDCVASPTLPDGPWEFSVTTYR